MRGDPAEQAEAQRVVGPVLALRVHVGIAGPPVQRRRVDHVGGQVDAGQAAEQDLDAGGAKGRAERADPLCVCQRLAQRRITGQQQAHIEALPRASACGSAPSTSPSPPVLTSGKISAPTCRMRAAPVTLSPGASFSSIAGVISVMPVSVRWKRRASSTGSSPTTSRRAGAAAVDDHAIQPHMTPDLDLRQQHRPVDGRIRVHAAAREQQRPDAARRR
jgi:hypothetical protein